MRHIPRPTPAPPDVEEILVEFAREAFWRQTQRHASPRWVFGDDYNPDDPPDPEDEDFIINGVWGND